jgi:acid phosphatase class B
MKVSFDFDGVLETSQGKALAQRKINNGDQVYIITARQESTMSNSVYEVAKELGIPRLHVYFTNGKDKWNTIKRLNIDVHYDNNEEQIQKIKDNTNTRAEKVSYE